ncbi:MAG: HWE histidine kinase domain-containing protein [Bradyrhizobium sp.]|nr:HWE histidine kinase domain-containing protein [Bradyrhizobium sp.]
MVMLSRGGAAIPVAQKVQPPEKSGLPDWDAAHLRLAIEAAGVALWSWNVDTNRFTMDERAFELWGVPLCEYVSFEDLSANIHPADRDRVKAAFAATRALVGAYEIDFRVMVGEEVRWISARGQGDDAGIVGRIMYGIFIDVTGRKQAEEGHELLAGEMSHRVKNLLAIATGLTAITSRSATTTADMAQELTHRLTALGRAHDLVRPLPGHSGKAALLGDLLTVLLAPYDDMGAFSGRVRVSVPRMGVGEQAATTLALVVHELATNSLKYGALSSPEGVLDISCAPHDTEVTVVWTESGGPPVQALTGDGGYGSKLLNRGMTVQLGGSISCDWNPEGVIVTLKMTKDRLTR